MSILLNLYHRLPPFSRDIAATARGHYLRWWRYGPETEWLVEEALERDRWSSTQWNNWQQERLAYVLHRAATQVPYYRQQWSERRCKGDKASWEDLKNWPILEKKTLRANGHAFVADDCNTRQMFRDHTSGTTGTPLNIFSKRETMRQWYALFEARIRRWNGVTWRQNWAILGGQLVVPPSARQPPFWVWNSAMHQLYLSANHLSPQNIPAFADALRKHKITHLVVYTSSATFLAHQLLEQGLNFKDQIQVVITNAEPLFAWQRSILETGFGCPVRETYGMAEIVAAASADKNDRLRLWPEAGYIEVLHDEQNTAAPLGTTGRLVGTSLINADMPLIRYEVGDRCKLPANYPAGDEQLPLPIIERIEGRTNDLLIAEDGRRLFWLNPVFYELPIVEAQIIQETLRDILIRYVPAPGFTEGVKQIIRSRLQERMGSSIQASLEEVERIPRTANGKFRAVICNLSAEERKSLE